MTTPDNKFANDGIITNQNVQSGVYVPPKYEHGTLDYSTSSCAESEANYVAGLMAESLQYAGGPVNVFPMLGIHNQGSTIDQPGDGYPICSGTPSGYNVLDGFNVNEQSWVSVQTGTDVITTPSYIGYDFGTKKAWEKIGAPQERYFPASPVRRQISSIKIKQSLAPERRALQLRIEASDDGNYWKRIDVVNVPNTDQLVSISVDSTAAYNKWRLIPIYFSGVASNSPWEVVELHLLEATQLSLDNIQDFILLENRDRSYCRTSSLLKCTYDLLDVQTELARFGINIPQTYIFSCSFADMVRILGRPIIIGDIVELPGEIQFDANLRPVRKWLEVTDTGWSTEGYTNNWRPNLFRFYAQPIMPSIEHKDILGVPGQVNDEQTDLDLLLNGKLQNDQAYQSTEAIKQAAADSVPQTGQDAQDVMSGKSIIGKPGSYDGTDLYSADGLPPDGAPYTFGDALPDPTTISDGHYHRQTYTNVPITIRPNDRLLRWNADISRWKVVEVNNRVKPSSHKKTMAAILSSTTKVNLDHKV